MQFAFTEDQETLRREARSVLSNGGWGREEVAELGFLDRAVLYEEAGRANRGDEFFEASAPENEQLAALSLEAVGISAKALELALEYAKAREQFGKPIGTYQAVSHKLSDTYVETELARSLAYWAAWCVAEGDEQVDVACAAAKAYCADAAVGGVRALDPGARRHRLHLGARAARVLQARAVDPGAARIRVEAPRADRFAPARIEVGSRHRRVVRDRGGVRAFACAIAVGACSRACVVRARRRKEREELSST